MSLVQYPNKVILADSDCCFCLAAVKSPCIAQAAARMALAANKLDSEGGPTRCDDEDIYGRPEDPLIICFVRCHPSPSSHSYTASCAPVSLRKMSAVRCASLHVVQSAFDRPWLSVHAHGIDDGRPWRGARCQQPQALHKYGDSHSLPERAFACTAPSCASA